MPSPIRLAVAFGVLCLIWSTSWFAIAVGVDDLPPITAAATRVGFAFLLLASVARRIARVEGGGRPPLWLSGMMGTFNIAYSYSVIYVTEQTLPSGITALLWGVFPLLMLVAGRMFLGEVLRPVHIVGFIGGFVGLVLLFLVDLRERGAGSVGAAAFLLTSPMVVAISQVFAKKYGGGFSATLFTRDALGIGAVLLVIAAFTLERDLERHWTGSAIASIAYLAVVATAIAFVLYYWILRHVSSSKLSTVSYVTPVLALAIGWAFRDETITPTTLAGALLVVGSVALALQRPVRAGNPGQMTGAAGKRGSTPPS